jgi:DNA polymerase III subunit beta
MRFSAPAAGLHAALAVVSMAADKRQDTPVRITAADGKVCFSVANPHAVIAISAVAEAIIIEDGEAAVSATTRLSALVSGFAPRAPVTISATETAATIACSDGRYRLRLHTDPPAALFVDEIARVELAAGSVLKLLEVLPAADNGRTRAYLAGMHLHSVGDQLVSVATDGTRLLQTTVTAKPFSADNRLIIPAKAAAMLARMLHQVAPDERVTLRRSYAAFAATTAGFELVTGMIDAAFPDYRRVIPKATGHAAVCDRAEIIAALGRLAAVAAGEVPPLVALAWDDAGPLRVFLPRQPDDGADVIAGQARGAAKIAIPLSQLAELLGEFVETDIAIEIADRGLLIREGGKLAVLMGCAWPGLEKEDAGAVAAALAK